MDEDVGFAVTRKTKGCLLCCEPHSKWEHLIEATGTR